MTAVAAVLPILLIILVGWIVANSRLVPAEQWLGFESIAYYVFFPSIIAMNLIQADFSVLPVATLGAVLVLTVLTMTAICFALRPLLKHRFGIEDARFTSIFQGATRWNTFIALAVAAALYGPEGVALIAVAIVAMVPLLNLINVTVLSVYGSGAQPSLRGLLLDLARNPLILSCVAGLALNLLALPLPGPVMDAVEMLGDAALAAGILAVGASLNLSALRRPGPALGTATVLKLAGMPLLGAFYAGLLDVSGFALGAVLVATTVPTAPGSYVLARRLGGDAKLMAEIITMETVLAAVTMPLFLALLA